MNHKFVNRIDGKVVYFSALGKRTFEDTKESKNFRYVGPITTAQQAKEEAEAAEHSNRPLTEEEEMEAYNRSLKKGSSNRKAKELTQEEMERATKNKIRKVKDDEEEEEEEEDEDRDLTAAEIKERDDARRAAKKEEGKAKSESKNPKDVKEDGKAKSESKNPKDVKEDGKAKSE